jgi:hypothetical protein
LFEKLMQTPNVPQVRQAGKPALLKKFAGWRRRGGRGMPENHSEREKADGR